MLLGLKKLMGLVQRMFSGLTDKQSIDVIIRVKEMNGGKLKGISKSKLAKLVKEAVSEKILREKECWKEEKKKTNKMNKTCPICFKILNTKQAKERHMRVHNKKDDAQILDGDIGDSPEQVTETNGDAPEIVMLPKWKCEKCEKIFSHEVSLKRHTKYHQDAESVPCSICDLTFKRRDNMYVHLSKVHNIHHINLEALRNVPKNSKSVQCKMCGEAFDSVKNFETHIVTKVCIDKERVINVNEEERYTCDLCDATYKYKKSLIAHLDWKHRSKKSFECETCGVNYTHKSSLVRHTKKLH